MLIKGSIKLVMIALKSYPNWLNKENSGGPAACVARQRYEDKGAAGAPTPPSRAKISICLAARTFSRPAVSLETL